MYRDVYRPAPKELRQENYYRGNDLNLYSDGSGIDISRDTGDSDCGPLFFESVSPGKFRGNIRSCIKGRRRKEIEKEIETL
jgi:hypothetical protein